MLARALRAERLPAGARVLDVCTGSGLLAVTAALGGAQATAVDLSRRAVLCADLNARLNGVRLRALRGDLFAPVRDERFDAIVCDLNMQGMSGMEFHAALPREQAEKVLFVTGGALSTAASEFLRSVAGRVLTKPVETPDLSAAVEALIEGRPIPPRS
jgi:ribosomal protein L11 methylase PrmA